MKAIHKKVWLEYFEEIISGKKKFELRLTDFEVNKGDTLVLEEWDQDKKEYTGRKVEVVATYILKTKAQKAELIFKPKPGQVDYTNIRWAPVVNCVVKHKDKILLVQRSEKLKLYPNFWNGISGFLDDDKSLEEKVKDELKEEAGIAPEDIISIKLGQIFDEEEPNYSKTWIVHPVLVEVKTDKVRLDWEAQKYEWVLPREARNFELVPGFEKVLETLFPDVDG